MSGKKIQFTERSNRSVDKFVDSWISGNADKEIKEKSVRTTIYLPESLRMQLKRKALDQDISVSELIIRSVTTYLDNGTKT